MTPSRILTLVAAALLAAIPLAAAPAKNPPAPKSLCALPHYPIAVGLRNEFRITSTQLDVAGKTVEKNTTSYSDEVVAVEANGFRTKTIADDNANESEWVCSEEGVALKYPEYPETTITTTGVVVPATMEVGSSWEQSFSLETQGTNQTVKTINRVTKREMVEVPAGTFEGWRIDYETETMSDGQEEPGRIRGTQWYVTSVGVVKSVSVVPVAMKQTRSVETVLELVAQTTK